MQTSPAAVLCGFLLLAPGLASSQESEVLGGVVGGMSDEDKERANAEGIVLDYDTPPKPIKVERPQYPQAAFHHNVQGTVFLEILIDTEGIVSRVRVVKS